MDGREKMALPRSASYYLNRGGIGGSGGPGPGHDVHGASAQAGVIRTMPVFETRNIPARPSVGVSGGAVSGSSFHVENPSPNFLQVVSMAIESTASHCGKPVKKKRGRPRKYGPDGANMSLGLSMSASGPSSAVTGPGEKARRGWRPPGTGWKQQLAPLGEWMNSSAGLAFALHVLRVGVGEVCFIMCCGLSLILSIRYVTLSMSTLRGSG